MPEETRERIVAGAYRALVEDGYEAASVKTIAGVAEVTPGLIHYYFRSKDDLLAAAIRQGGKQWRPAPDDGSTQELLAVFEAAKTCATTCQEFNRLLFCTCGVGLHNPAIAQAVRDVIQEERAYVEGLVRQHMAQRGLSVSETTAIAASVWGSLTGIGLQTLMDPDFEVETAIDALAWLVGLRQSPSSKQTNQQQEGGTQCNPHS
jgi:AcrR family transcriptional regulator